MIHRKQFVPSNRKKIRSFTIVFILIVLALFIIPPTRHSVKKVGSFISMPFVRIVHTVGGWFSGIGTALERKSVLEKENKALTAQVTELEARLVERNAIAKENAEFREMLGRSDSASFTLAAVLTKPPRSAYGTMVIDGGSRVGFSEGDIVYASGKTPIGKIESVLPRSALVRLYTFPGEELEVRLSPSGIDATLVGRGGGNFSMEVPHGFIVPSETVARTKEIDPHIVAVLEKITSDPREPLQTLLLTAPVNIMELSFVEVDILE